MRRFRRKARLTRKVRPFKRRRYGRRVYARKHAVSKRFGFLMPDRLLVKLKWTLTFTITDGGTGLYTRVFGGNNAFDPDTGAGSSQPTGWDQYAALYRNYYVGGSKFKLEAINTGSTDITTLGVIPATTQLSTTDLGTMIPTEWPYCTERTLGPLTSSFSRTILKRYMSTKKIVAYKTSNNANFVTATSSAPTANWYWNLYATGSGSSFGNVTARLQITYYVQFFGRQEIATS